MSDQRWRIHWGWLPAAVFLAVIGWSRYGWWLVLLIVLGVSVGVYGEWKARSAERRVSDPVAAIAPDESPTPDWSKRSRSVSRRSRQ